MTNITRRDHTPHQGYLAWGPIRGLVGKTILLRVETLRDKAVIVGNQ